MPASQAFLVLPTLLISLLPLACYCLVLAAINRRDRPLLVRGVWDFVGVLAAVSGMLLWTVPVLIMLLYQRAVTTNPGTAEPQTFDDIWAHWWIVWACYYGLLIGGTILLLVLRTNVTAIYNVDVEVVSANLVQTLRNLGYDLAHNDQNQILIAPAKSLMPGAGPATFIGAVEIDTFPGMAHAALHWFSAEKHLRNEVEREFSKQIASTRPADNPATLWFLGTGAILIGAAFLAVLFSLMMAFLPRH